MNSISNIKYRNNVGCTVCGSKKSTVLLSKFDYRQTVDLIVNRCNVCKNIYLGSYDEEYADDLYDYYNKYLGKSKEELFSELTKKSYLNVLALISRYASGKSILDVGCGKGDFVDTAMSAGWTFMGLS